MRVFIDICVYYWIWIKDFAVIAQLIYILFRKSQVFIWKDSQIWAMKILKLVLIIAPAFKIIDYSEGADMIICAVDTSGEGWGDNLIQVEQNGKQQHAIWYESGIWFNVEKCYDAGK